MSLSQEVLFKARLRSDSMKGLKLTVDHLTQKVIAYLLVCIITVSGLTVVPPAVGINPYQSFVEPIDKIDESLLNQTSLNQLVDVLVGYNQEVGEFKAKNAILYADKAAELVNSFESIGMLHVKMLGESIMELAKEAFITKIWSNEITPIEQVQKTSITASESEDYIPLIDRIGARNLWDAGYNGTGTVIAVLDTGVDPLQTDFSVAAFASFVEADTLPLDLIGHGTYAASVAVNSGNSSDGTYAGIAPGATLLSAKVTLGGLFAAPSWIVSGIEWASSRGADIILLPFNTLGAPGDAVSEAVEIAAKKGIFVVAASGDDGPDYLTVMSPGGNAAAFCVGAYDTKLQRVPDFSGRGPSLSLLTKPDLVAPGVGIVGAKPFTGLAGLGFGDIGLGDLGDLGGLGGLLGGSIGETYDENYTIADTTAASAAITAGAAAILIQAFDRVTPITLANVLRDTATNIGYGANDGGAGLLNLQAAFDYLSTQQTPADPHARTTSLPLLALGLISASGTDASTTMLMSSFGTTLVALDERNPQDSGIHLMMGMFSLKWNNEDPTNLMMFDVKSEFHQVISSSQNMPYNRYVGVLSHNDSIYVTFLVESYNLTTYSPLPLTAFRITPFIFNIGNEPVENVSLYVSYSLDLYLDGENDHGKYDLDNQQLFAYGLSETYGNFYVGMNSSIPLSAFEVGNSSTISNHVSNNNLTDSTVFDGDVGLALQWDFGTLDVDELVNVTIALGFGENRTILDASIDAMWQNDIPEGAIDQGDLIVVEADVPRIAEAGNTYQSTAVIMNIGEENTTALGAMLVLETGDNNGTVFARYFNFENIEPFKAKKLVTEWRPETEGIRTAAWAVSTGLDQIIGLISDISGLMTSAVGLLDDFILRDVFIITPISSTSVFPKILPFAPFDVRFPADFGLYSFVLSTTESLGNLTIANHGNASDWGNMSLASADTIEGFYDFSLFILAPPIGIDGYHRCDYVLETEFGWTTNITLERVIEYPRAMMLLDTSHGGGFGSLLGDAGGFGGTSNLTGEAGGMSFPLAQEEPPQEDATEGLEFSLTDLGSLDSLSGLFDAFRMTTFSGLSNMDKRMADVGLDLIETPGMELDPVLLAQFSTVFIIAPTEEFNSTEIETLREFTANGGTLIILGDNDDNANTTVLNPVLLEYGYYLAGTHDKENTTDIVTTSLFGAGLESMWLGGGTYVMNNQSNAQVRLNGNSVVMLDDTTPDLAIFGSSKIFMNKNLVKCNNSLLLDNLNQYLLRNTLTAETSLSENTTLYEAGKSVYVNLVLTDYYGNPVDDLFVAIAYELPNGSLAFFIAGFVEDGLYSSQFAPSYWRSSGRINGIFLILGSEDYAMTYACVTFYLYEVPPPTGPPPPPVWLTMAQIAFISSIGIFGSLIGLLVYNRRRMKKRLRIPEIQPELVREIDNTLNTLLAAFTQLEDLIQREDLDRVQKIEALRVLMSDIEEGRRMFDRVSDKVGGV
ncbi:MAG: S8 family serine peptidase [Candidatus Thorarchaeota archaeon]